MSRRCQTPAKCRIQKWRREDTPLCKLARRAISAVPSFPQVRLGNESPIVPYTKDSRFSLEIPPQNLKKYDPVGEW